MKPWTRDDTKCWIEVLEGRLDDINYYLDRTTQWCEENYIENERTVFICCFLTCIWVSQLRGEDITYIELMELLGIEDIETLEEKIFSLDAEYLELEHDELLKEAVAKLEKDQWD
jgi:hypothetical protein